MRAGSLVASWGALIFAVAGLLAGASVPAEVVGAHPGDRAGGGRGADLDASAAAIPTVSDPDVTDTADVTVRATAPDDKAVAAAVATADCDGCNGRSTVLQVVHFDARRGGAAADNSAAAWSTCSGCGSSAVSVQLVLVRHPAVLRVNNRALALNASREECTTTAAAIQLVLAGSGRELSAQARELIGDIQQELADRLAATAAPAAAARGRGTPEQAAEEAAAELERVVTSDVGATTVQRSLDVRVGG